MTLSPRIEAEFIPVDAMLAMLAAQTHRRFMKADTPADDIPSFDAARYVVVLRGRRCGMDGVRSCTPRHRGESSSG